MSDEKQVSIEESVKSVIDKKISEGLIEKLVAENLEKGVNKALEDILGSYGDVTKVIKDKIKSVMISQLGSYDFSKYVVKLDTVLTEILKSTSLDNKKILENFQDLMTDREFPKVIKLSDIFEEYKKYVAEEVDTSDLEVNTDDEPTYECVPVSMEVEREDKRSWSDWEYAKVVFECEKDEKLNLEIRIHKWDKNAEGWSMSFDVDTSINSLRHLDDFKIYLLKLNQSTSKIELDSEYLDDEVEPEAEPEASFS